MKLAALGRTHWLYRAIEVCVTHGHQIVVIGTAPAAPEYQVREEDFARLARRLGCPYFCDARLGRVARSGLLQQSGAEGALSVNWPTLIRAAVLDIFHHGILNFHCGDLPRYRGNACPNWAILNNEPEVVLTIHQMVEALDAGPILVQRRMPLTDETYIRDVYDYIDNQVPQMFAQAVSGLESGAIIPRPQPESPALSLRCFPRTPPDGLIDWRMTAPQIARLVRASSDPFAGAYTYLGDRRLTIWRARAASLPYPWCGCPGQIAELNPESGEVSVLTGADVLVLQEVSWDNEPRQPASSLLTSTRLRLGGQLPERLEKLERRLAQLEAQLTLTTSIT